MVQSDLEDGTSDQKPPSLSVVSQLHPDKCQYKVEVLRIPSIAGIYKLLCDIIILSFCHMIPCTIYMSAPKRVRFMLEAHNI